MNNKILTLSGILITIILLSGIFIMVNDHEALITIPSTDGNNYQVYFTDAELTLLKNSDKLMVSKYDIRCYDENNKEYIDGKIIDFSDVKLIQDNEDSVFISQDVNYDSGILTRVLWVNGGKIKDTIRFVPNNDISCELTNTISKLNTEQSSEVFFDLENNKDITTYSETNFVLDWGIDSKRINTVEKTTGGNLIINYNSKNGMQLLDPEIELINVIDKPYMEVPIEYCQENIFSKKCVTQIEIAELETSILEDGLIRYVPMSEPEQLVYQSTIQDIKGATQIYEENGIPIKSNGEVVSYISDSSQEIIINPFNYPDGELTIGFATNSFYISSFSTGTLKNVLSSATYGLELANNDSQLFLNNLSSAWMFANGTLNDTATGRINHLGGIGVTSVFDRYVLDGGDWFNVKNELAFSEELEGGFTATAWVKTNDTTRRNSVYGFTAAANNRNWELFQSLLGKITFQWSNGTATDSLAVVASLISNNWSFIAASYNPNGTIMVYQDGVVITKVTTTFYQNTSSSTLFYVGNLGGSSALGWNGSMDSHRIYNTSLNLQQLQQLHDSGLFFNSSSKSTANYTTQIFTPDYGSWDRYINNTFDCVNLSAGSNSNCSQSYRTAKLVRPEEESNLTAFIVAGYLFNMNSTLGDNESLVIDYWGSNNATCTKWVSPPSEFCPINTSSPFDGELEYGTRFNGRQSIGAWMVVPNNSVNPMNKSSNFSVMAWVNAYDNSSHNLSPSVVSYGRDVGSSYSVWGGWNIYRDYGSAMNNKVKYCVQSWTMNGSVIYTCSSATKYTEFEWHHLTYTYNNTKICLFVDGNLEECDLSYGQRLNMTFARNISSSNDNIQFCVGALGYGCNTSQYRQFEGAIDDVFYFNKSLDQSEIISWQSWSAKSYAINGTTIDTGKYQRFLQLRYFLNIMNNFEELNMRFFNVTYNYKPIQEESETPDITINNVNNPVSVGKPILNTTNNQLTHKENITFTNGSIEDYNNDSTTFNYVWMRNGELFNIMDLTFNSEGDFTNPRDYIFSNGSVTYSGNLKWCETCGYGQGGGFEFGGTSGIMAITSKNFSKYQNYTVFLRFKVHGNSTGAGTGTTLYGGNYARLITSGKYGNYHIHYTWNNSGNPCYQFITRYDQFPTVGDNYANYCKPDLVTNSLDVWQSIAAVYDEHNRMLLYLNGTLVANSSMNVSGTRNAYTGNTTAIYLGSTTLSFNGTEDDIMVFNASLTGEQIRMLHNNQSNMIDSSMIEPGDLWKVISYGNDRFTDSNAINMSIQIREERFFTHFVSITWVPLKNIIQNVTSYFVLFFDDNSTSKRNADYSVEYSINSSSGLTYRNSNPFGEFESNKDRGSSF